MTRDIFLAETDEGYTYVCPYCRKRMDYVGQDKRCTVHYEYTFYTREWDINEHDDCEFIEFYCPNCNKVLPADIEKEIWEQIKIDRLELEKKYE